MLHILNKHLTNERAWARNEQLGVIDRKYKEAARMAKERIPQLEQAIKLITKSVHSPLSTAKPAIDNRQSTKQKNQLSIFN